MSSSLCRAARFAATAVISLSLFPLCPCAHALVNPSLQPLDLHERHTVVLAAEVTQATDHSATLKVQSLFKGEFAPKEIVFELGGEPAGEGEEGPPFLEEGQIIVAFVGKKVRNKFDEILLYVGDREWHSARMKAAETPGEWKWEEKMPETMVGTFNGDSARLVEMMMDARDGKYFFPAAVSARFAHSRTVVDLGKPVSGLALYDLDGDGSLDILGCAGDKVVLMRGGTDAAFKDVTATSGLAEARGKVCDVADVDGDGHADLLLDQTLFLQRDGKFVAGEPLLATANAAIKTAAFCDLNQDGRPDVLLSLAGGGLRALVNTGQDGKSQSFADATKAMGLDSIPDGDGYFILGDWNLDGRTDIFYAVNNGLLLTQNLDGKFEATPHGSRFSFKGGPDLQPGVTGAGVMAGIWRPERVDLVVPQDSGMVLLHREESGPRDVTGFGNEIALSTSSQRASLAVDLNLDGLLDLFTISRDLLGSSIVHINRGYGSFMQAEIYEPNFFQSEAFGRGAGTVVAGDLNADGADDIIIGGLDGKVTLVLNTTRELRSGIEHPNYHDRILRDAALLTVEVRGRSGVNGARVELRDGRGTLVALRQIARNIPAGSRGPDATTFSVHTPGDYTVTTLYSDGHLQKRSVSLAPKESKTVRIDRETPPTAP
jgi:hypothetical protein